MVQQSTSTNCREEKSTKMSNEIQAVYVELFSKDKTTTSIANISIEEDVVSGLFGGIETLLTSTDDAEKFIVIDKADDEQVSCNMENWAIMTIAVYYSSHNRYHFARNNDADQEKAFNILIEIVNTLREKNRVVEGSDRIVVSSYSNHPVVFIEELNKIKSNKTGTVSTSLSNKDNSSTNSSIYKPANSTNNTSKTTTHNTVNYNTKEPKFFKRKTKKPKEEVLTKLKQSIIIGFKLEVGGMSIPDVPDDTWASRTTNNWNGNKHMRETHEGEFY